MVKWLWLFGMLPVIGMVPDATQIESGTFFNAVQAGNIEVYGTMHSIGIEWDVAGDDDHDATCTVRYRMVGGSYKQAMPLYRVDFEGENMLAGSVLFLNPGTNYEIELTLVDPDGGGTTSVQTFATRPIPVMPQGGQTYHVIPDDGGASGDGSEANPFKGVEEAEAAAAPGDIMLLHVGNYGGVVYFNTAGAAGNYLVWKAAGDGDPVFEGVRIETNYIWLEGLKIIDQQYGLRTSPPGPLHIVVKGCYFSNNHYSIFLNDGGQGWYIADNTIVGDNIPNTSNFSGEGIELEYTNGHTVAYNTISRVADGISYPGRNVDMFGNDIFDTSDDGIEFDYGFSNNRAWRNRITNLYNNGISFQPMDGAPYYVLFNQVSVLNGQSVLKLRSRSDRALIAHNTFIINSGPMASGSHLLADFEIKNNLWISINDRYAWESGTIVGTNWKTDFDFDGFDWGNYQYAFKWDDIRLDDIAAFTAATGQEQNGIAIDHNTCFEHLNYTETGGQVDSFFIEYNTLAAGCNAIDAGTPLPNINDGYIGVAPDLGAYEVGQALPHYGVRTTCTSHAINYWVGSNNALWNANPNNWSLGHIPTACDQVVVEAGKTLTLDNGEMGFGYSLNVHSLAQLIVLPNAILMIE